jgi:hypothetical protein
LGDFLTTRQVECGGDLRTIGAMPDRRRIGPVAEHQTESVYQDGLTGPGLAGQYRHAIIEFQLDFVDDGVIADPDLLQH